MADTSQEIIIKLKASDETGKVFEGVAKNAQKTQSSFTSMAGAVAAGTAAFELAKAAIQQVGAFLSSTVDAALEDEKAFEGLQNTMKIAGVQADQANAAFADQVKHLQQLGFAGAETNAAQSRFLQLTKDVTEATKLSNLAAEVARQKNIDLASATDFVQRVMLNGGAAARKMGYAVSETATNVEALNAIQKEAGKSAEAFAQTTAGKIQIAQNAWEELKGAIGARFLPVLATVAEFITKVATDPRMETFLNTVGDIVVNYVVPAIQFLATTLGNFGKFAAQILSGFADIFGATSSDVQNWVAILGETLKVLITGLGTAALIILTGFKALVGGFVSFGKSMAATAASIWNVILDGVQLGLSFISKQINKVIDAYDTVSKALGGNGTTARVNFDVSAFKVDTSTIDALNQGAADTFGKTVDGFKKDLGSIDSFVKSQVAPKVKSASADAGKAAGDAFGAGFNQQVLGKIAKGSGGDGGAADAMKKTLDQMFFDLKAQGDAINKMVDTAKQKTKEWGDITLSVQNAYKDVGGALSKAGIEVKGLTDAQATVKLSAKDAVAAAIDSMKEYASAVIDAKKQVSDLSDQLKKLQSDQSAALSQNAADTARSGAEKVAEIQKTIADAQSQLMGSDVSDDQRTALQKQINDSQAILASHADFIKENAAEVKRAQDLANMDELARIIALGKEKSDQITKEYNDKVAAAQADLKLAQEKYDSELAQLQAANANVKAEQDKAKQEYAQYLIDSETLTNSHISAEIAKYNTLAAAVRNAAKGVSTSFTPEQNATLDAFLKGVPKMAEGGIITKPTLVLAGEAGSEAIVPLDKAGGMGETHVHVMENANVTVGNGMDVKAVTKEIAQGLARALQSQRLGAASPI